MAVFAVSFALHARHKLSVTLPYHAPPEAPGESFIESYEHFRTITVLL